MRIGTAKDVRKLDAAVITDYGVPQSVLMENAAFAAKTVADSRWGIEDRNVLVVCGSGNNGGDGFALARLLYAKGAAVTVLMAGNPENLKGAAADNFQTIRSLPLEITHSEVIGDFERFDYIVDALFGTGLSRPVEGRAAALIESLNRSTPPILSLDIPSGIDADTGEELGTSVRADATVTFGIPKRGNLLYPGFTRGGCLYYSEISFPPEVTGDESLTLSVNVPPPPPHRDSAGHKGSFGKVLIIGGSENYRGAPTFAAAAALKTGAGYARLAVPSDLAPQIFPLVPEAVFLPMEGNGSLGAEHVQTLLEQAAAADTVVLGPGLSTHPESVRLVREFIPAAEATLVVDGDALTALAGREELCRDRPFPTVLTPHPGEMARLLGSSIKEIESRRVETALEAADRYGCLVILKGAHSLIASPSGRAWMNLTGNAGMGTAGSGDILSGLIGALAAQCGNTEHALEDAVRLGVHIHGLAGDLAAEKMGEVGMTAGDILESLPAAFREFGPRLASDPFSGKITLI